MKLIHIPFEEAKTGELYLTKTKHGWIEGYWDGSNTCHKYYFRDMEWFPEALYRIVEE